MKTTVDGILAQHNIRLYNGSWYVHEKKLREMLEQVIEEIYDAVFEEASEQFEGFSLGG